MKRMICAVLSALIMIPLISCGKSGRRSAVANTKETEQNAPDNSSVHTQNEPEYRILDLTKHERQEVFYVTGEDIKELFVLAADYYRDYDEIRGEIITESTRASNDIKRETITVVTDRNAEKDILEGTISEERRIGYYSAVAEIFMMNVNLLCSSDIIYSEFSEHTLHAYFKDGITTFSFPFLIGLYVYPGGGFKLSPLEVRIRDAITEVAWLAICKTENDEYTLLFGANDTKGLCIGLAGEDKRLTEV